MSCRADLVKEGGAPPPPADAAASGQLRQLHGLKDALEESHANSVMLLRELALRLREHEAELEASAASDQHPSTRRTPTRARLERSGSAWGSRCMPAELDELSEGEPSKAELMVGATWSVSANAPHDSARPPSWNSMSPICPDVAVGAQYSGGGHRGHNALRRLDVAALEVCQGWRRRLPDDFGGGALRRRGSMLSMRHVKPNQLDIASCILVTVNLIAMMVEVEVDMRHTMAGVESPIWLWIVNLTLTVLFVFEVLLRIKLEGTRFVHGPNWMWNFFDVFAVTAQLLDVILTFVSVGFLRVIRMLRMIRAARIIKTARYVRELRLMIAALTASLPSLTWALVLILLTMALYAMFILQVVRAHITEKGPNNVDERLVEFYGSLPSCMLVLSIAVTGGNDWLAFVEPLIEISGFYVVSFAMFMVFLLWGMLNILTAIFVDSTKKLSDYDADLVIMEQLDQETSSLNKMRHLLVSADLNGSGTISQSEFDEKLEDPKFKAEMHLMDLHVHEARAAFHLIDAEGTGEVDIDEMIHGLMRLKGSAKALDMAEMLFESKRVFSSIKRLADSTEHNFRDLRLALHAAGFGPTSPGSRCGLASPGCGVLSPTGSTKRGRALSEICKEIAHMGLAERRT